MLKVLLWLFCMSGWFFSLGKVAAQSPSAELGRMSIEDLMDIMIASVSKFEQRLADAPASVSIVTSDDIAKYGCRTLAEILRSAARALHSL